MIVASVMTRNPIFVSPDMSITEAKALMIKEKIGKLPVLDKNNKLIGIITKKDLVKAGPSAATTLDMYEIGYLLSKLKVEKVMEKKVITVQQTEVVEEAARIMADNAIGCLPIMKDDLLVGIITDTDLFRAFINMFGARKKGIRVTFQLVDKLGVFARVTKNISEKKGNIVSLVTADGSDLTKTQCTMKVSGISKEEIERILQEENAELEDIR